MKILLVGESFEINKAYKDMLKTHKSLDFEKRIIQGASDSQYVISAKMRRKTDVVAVVLTIKGQDYAIQLNRDTFKQIALPGKTMTISGTSYDVFSSPKSSQIMAVKTR